LLVQIKVGEGRLPNVCDPFVKYFFCYVFGICVCDVFWGMKKLMRFLFGVLGFISLENEVSAQSQSNSMVIKMDKESKIAQVVFYNQADTLKGKLQLLKTENGKIVKYVIKKGPLRTISLTEAQLAQIKVHRVYKRWAFPVTVEYPDGQTGTRWPTYLEGNDLLLGVMSEKVTEAMDEETAATFELQTYCWKYKGESVAIDEDFLAQNLSRWENDLGIKLGLVPTDAFNREKLIALTRTIEPHLAKWPGW
jgi:hypothetical protein